MLDFLLILGEGEKIKCPSGPLPVTPMRMFIHLKERSRREKSDMMFAFLVCSCAIISRPIIAV